MPLKASYTLESLQLNNNICLKYHNCDVNTLNDLAELAGKVQTLANFGKLWQTISKLRQTLANSGKL